MTSQPSRVTVDDMVAGFRELGVIGGDVVLVHASLSKFGHVDGGVDTVITSLLEAVAPGGTVAMPGFSFHLRDIPRPVFDVRNTPCWASRIYERFRIRDGVHRSHHVSHSVLAEGARAQELTANHSVTPCGAHSPFRKLVDWGGKILLLGVSHNSSTTFHAVEEQEGLFYVGYQDLEGATIIDEQGRQRPIRCQAHDMSRRYDFNRMDEPLECEGIQRQLLVGDAIVRCIDARRMFDLAVQAVRKDAEALVVQGLSKLEVPVCRPSP